jgi:oligopeptide transport system substrate-binding protein
MLRRGNRGSSAAARRLAVIVLVAGLATLAVAGCGGGGGSTNAGSANAGAGPAKTGGTITIGYRHDTYWDSIDPNLAWGLSTWEVTRQICIPLVYYPSYGGAKGMNLVPGAASALPTVSPDGLTYTFNLRQGEKFSNGQPLTANDVKYTFYRMLKVNPDAGDVFGSLKGVDAVASGKAKSVSGIDANGQTVTFHLTQPNGGFLYSLSLQFTCPVPANTPAKRDESGKIPGNGPYMIQSYTPGRKIVMVRNPRYDPALGPRGNADKLVFNLALDGTQALQDTKLGQVDLPFDGLPAGDAQQALTDPALKGRIYSNTSPTLTYLWLNTDVPPFDNPKVRQAVNYAVDRTEIVKVVGGPAAAKVTDQMLPPTLDGNAPKLYPTTPDLAKAKALMQASGVKTPVTTTLTAPSMNDWPQVAQVVQADLKKIGINLKIKVGSVTVLSALSAKRAHHVPAGFGAWTQDYPDGQDWLQLVDPRFVEGGGQKSRFHVASLTPTFEKLDKETGQSRQTGYQQLATTIMRDYSPWVPMYFQVVTLPLSNHVTNFAWQPQIGMPVLTSLSVK